MGLKFEAFDTLGCRWWNQPPSSRNLALPHYVGILKETTELIFGFSEILCVL